MGLAVIDHLQPVLDAAQEDIGVGQALRLELLRAGQPVAVEVTVGERRGAAWGVR